MRSESGRLERRRLDRARAAPSPDRTSTRATATGLSPTAPVTSVDTPIAASASAPRTTSSTLASAGRVAVHRGDLDLVRITADRVAVAAQHIELVRDLGRVAEDVARVGVLRDEPQRLPLAAAADQDPRARHAHRHAGCTASRRAGSAGRRTRRRCRSTSAGRSGSPPPAARTARPSAGTARPARGARARTTRRRCRVRPARPTRRRAW